MPKKPIVSILFALLICVPTAFAEEGGDGAGNGGKGIYCPQPDGTRKLVVLDYSRAEHEWKLPPARFPESGDETSKAVEILRRLAEKDPYRASRYELYARRFVAKMTKVASFRREPTRDSDEIAYCPDPDRPDNKPIQVIVQSRKDAPWNRDFDHWVHAGRWESADTDQRAGWIAHEAILNEGIKEANWEKTDPAMLLNARLVTGAIDRMSQEDYEKGFLQDEKVRLKVLRRENVKNALALKPGPRAVQSEQGYRFAFNCEGKSQDLYMTSDQARAIRFEPGSLMTTVGRMESYSLDIPSFGVVFINPYFDASRRAETWNQKKWEDLIAKLDPGAFLKLKIVGSACNTGLYDVFASSLEGPDGHEIVRP